MTLKAQSKLDLSPLINRRRFLQFGAGLATSLSVPTAFAKSRAPDRVLSLHSLHTGERLKATYWADGQYQHDELAAINHILRDHRSGEVMEMDLNLVNLLNLLHDQVNGKKSFDIISGYRSPQTNESLRSKSSGVAKKSYHMKGQAIDLALPGRDLSNLHKAALALKTGGVGYYPRSGFIHVDTGPVRNWS